MGFTRAFRRVFFQMLGLMFPIWGGMLVTILLLGLAFSAVEHISVFKALYFACITAMTIGYGDITPATPLGKILSVCIGLNGIILTGIVVSIALQAVKVAYEKKTGTAAPGS